MEQIREAHAKLTEELERRHARNLLANFTAYPKQLEFYETGTYARERLLLAANRVGKTYSGSFEVAMHLTGRYPDWWNGKRFDRPVRVWCGSDTGETTRDTVQANLIGPPPDPEAWGTAAIPADCILDTARRAGIPDALDNAVIQHVSGKSSYLGFKSYDQGRRKWQGTTKDIVWFDEEPPEDVYFEGLTRTNDVEDGFVMLTFTPLSGMSAVVLRFLGIDTEGQGDVDVEAALQQAEKGTPHPPTPPVSA